MLCFSQFRIDASNQELWRGSEKLEIRRKSFEVLSYLARNPRRLISRDELLSNIWTDGAAVGDGLLRAYIWELRHLLGDNAKSPRYLETVNRRGYRFLPAVTTIAAGSDNPNISGDSASGDSPSSQPNQNSVASATSFNLTGAGDAVVNRERLSAARLKAVVLPISVGILHSLTGRIEAVVADGRSDAAEFARKAEFLIAEKGASPIWMLDVRTSQSGPAGR